MLNRKKDRTPLYFPYILASTLLFIISFLIPKGNDVLWINGHHHPVLDGLLPVISRIGEAIPFTILLVVTLFIRFQYTVITAIAWISHGLLVSLCKQVLFPGMPRPKNFLDTSALHFIPGIDVHGHHSFPSGHTATAFCFALLVTLIFRNNVLSLFVLILALLVVYARVYMLQHFVMDVAAGAIIGTFTTYVVWSIQEGNRKPAWMRRQLRFRSNKTKTTTS